MTKTAKKDILADMSGHVAAGYPRRNLSARISPVLIGLIMSLPVALHAQNASVDQLIKKLPPPEKVGKTDPAGRDPLAKQIAASAKAMNFGNAYALSQKLVAKYPQSAGAEALQGQLALAMRRYSEAASAFHKAISLQPDFAFAHLGLALTDLSQQRFKAAMTDFGQVTHILPNNEIGWIGLSVCSEKLGRKKESLDYARRSTSVAPSSFAAWQQLAREEGVSGNQQAAAKAMNRANELRRVALKRSGH